MLSRVLYVDLANGTSEVVDREELFKEFIGGVGVSSKILLEETREGYDPFSPESPIIFAAGPLTAVYPCMAKAVSLFKSPLTGNLGESHGGGHFAASMVFAGYGAIVIKGASDTPIFLEIRDEDVKVRRAYSLWHLSPLKVERLLRNGGDVGIQSIASCGVAGENSVYYSNVLVDRYHHFGRLGLGAIFGSKKLKAISIIGDGALELSDSIAVKELYEKLHHKIIETGVMKKYHDYGTPGNILELNELGALPTKNFSQNRFEDAEKISGEVFAETLLKRKVSCVGCPIACVHLGSLKTGFSPEHERGRREIFQEERLVPYNYEPMFALGSNLLIDDKSGLLKLIERCEDLGLDAMMTGNVLAWTTEAFEDGRISVEDTMNLKPMWGDVDTYLELIDRIASPQNRFFVKLAQGLDAAAEKYGGKDYAMALGKNGLPGYLTGYGNIVGVMVGARHSHLSNSGYSIDQKTLGSEVDADKIAEFLVNQEDYLYILYSLVICYFSRSVYTLESVSEALKTMGLSFTTDDLEALGKKIFHNLYTFKLREGFDLFNEEVPNRVFEVKTPHNQLRPEILKSIFEAYVKKRRSEGLPLKREEKALLDLLKPKD